MIGSRLVRRRAEKPSFFEVFFTITSIQILLDLARVTDLYILTHFGPLYKTRVGRLWASLGAKSQKLSKMGHA